MGQNLCSPAPFIPCGTYPSGERKRNVHAFGCMLSREMKPAVLEHLQHRNVLGQNLRDQLIEPRPTGNRSKMAHQCRADPLSLVLVDDGKSHLGCPRLSDNVTRASDDQGLTVLFHYGHQGNVVDEVNVHEECDFLLREAALGSKEAAEERLGAGASDSGDKAGSVVWPEGTDLDPAPVAQCLDD